jgi:hypothetical protein
MLPFAGTLRHLADRYLADSDPSSQHTARTNAAEAHAVLRRRLREQHDVDAYVRAQLKVHRGTDERGTSQGAPKSHAPGE